MAASRLHAFFAVALAASPVAWAEETTAPQPALGGFESGLLGSGEAWNRTFDEPGTFQYYCRPHNWMRGAVEIRETPNATAPPVVRIVGFSFHPARVEAAPGTRVEWVNEDDVPHSVTQMLAEPAQDGTGVLLVLLAGAGVVAVPLYVLLRRRP